MRPSGLGARNQALCIAKPAEAARRLELGHGDELKRRSGDADAVEDRRLPRLDDACSAAAV